jgi:uracil-DNA glycosylase
VKPEITIALGATAARQLLGKAVTITATRGRVLELPEGGLGWVTIHPSYLLRLPDKAKAEDEFAAFVEDLKGAAGVLT